VSRQPREIWLRRPDLTRAILLDVFTRDRGICHICRGPVLRQDASVDHVVPRSIRPDLTFVRSNLRLAHRDCNSSRGVKPLSRYHHAVGW